MVAESWWSGLDNKRAKKRTRDQKHLRPNLINKLLNQILGSIVSVEVQLWVVYTKQVFVVHTGKNFSQASALLDRQSLAPTKYSFEGMFFPLCSGVALKMSRDRPGVSLLCHKVICNRRLSWYLSVTGRTIGSTGEGGYTSRGRSERRAIQRARENESMKARARLASPRTYPYSI